MPERLAELLHGDPDGGQPQWAAQQLAARCLALQAAAASAGANEKVGAASLLQVLSAAPVVGALWGVVQQWPAAAATAQPTTAAAPISSGASAAADSSSPRKPPGAAGASTVKDTPPSADAAEQVRHGRVEGCDRPACARQHQAAASRLASRSMRCPIGLHARSPPPPGPHSCHAGVCAVGHCIAGGRPS